MFRKPIYQKPVEFIIAGLGNPGREYENTRHNSGYLVLDAIAEKYSAEVKRLKFKGLTAQCVISGKNVLLLKPTTFMNLSGRSVTEAMRFFKLPPENVLIIFDDISLEPGKLRIRRKGSDGGHNGMKNIIFLSGSDMFPRIKIGVGAKPHPDYELASWVLSRFTKAEREAVEKAAENAVSAAELIVASKIDEAMSLYN